LSRWASSRVPSGESQYAHDLVEVVADVVVVADGPSVAALGVQMQAAAPAHLLTGRGGRQEGPGELDQLGDGGPDPGLLQGLDEAPAVLLGALPDEPGHPAEGVVQIALHVQVTGHPGAGQTEFSRLPQQAAQGAAVAYDESGSGGRPGLRTVPGAKPYGERCSE
jgi:hypothetical protein